MKDISIPNIIQRAFLNPVLSVKGGRAQTTNNKAHSARSQGTLEYCQWYELTMLELFSAHVLPGWQYSYDWFNDMVVNTTESTSPVRINFYKNPTPVILIFRPIRQQEY